MIKANVDPLEQSVLAEEPDDLVDAAIEVPKPANRALELKKTRKPWHALRKHWCRIHQWCAPVLTLVKDLKLGKDRNRAFRYLSLPGDELLDIRTLHGVFKRQGVYIQFLGYNTATVSPRREEADLSFSEVRALEWVQRESSLIVNERLEKLSDPASVAFRSFEKHAPFDAVNIDLCGSALGQAPLAAESLLEALRKIAETQMALRGEPWLFLLTSRMGRASVHLEAQRVLVRRLLENCRDEEFRSGLVGGLLDDVGIESLEAELNGQPSLDDTRLSKLLGLALCKWFAALGTSVSRPWTVVVETCAVYSVYGETNDMFSVGLRFVPTPTQTKDAFGLTSGSPNDADPPLALEQLEVVAARAMIQPITDAVNVDALLQEDSTLFEKTRKQAADIMASARHVREDYLEWVDSGCPTEAEAAQGSP